MEPVRDAILDRGSLECLDEGPDVLHSGQVYRGEAPAGKLRDIGLGSDYAQARLRNRLLRDI